MKSTMTWEEACATLENARILWQNHDITYLEYLAVCDKVGMSDLEP